MNHVGTIRKTVGRSLNELSPFQRIENLRLNAKPFTDHPKYETKSSGVIIRKVVGPTRSE